MAYTKINTFAGATSSQANLDADIDALRTAVNSSATADLVDDSIGKRHFVDPKSLVFHRVVDGPLVGLGWERRCFGENMFAVVRKTECWSGELSKIRNRRDYFVRSLPEPRTVTLASTRYTIGLTPIISKRFRLGDRGSCVVKIFATVAHAMLQDYSGTNTTTEGYPGTAKEDDGGYFLLAYKPAAATAWIEIDGTKRHTWPSDDAFDQYRAVCDYNVSTVLDLDISEGDDYDIALCYFRATSTAGLEQLIVGPTSLMLTAYHKA